MLTAGLLSFEAGYKAIANVWSYGLEEFLIAFFQSYGVILKYKGIIEIYDDINPHSALTINSV